MYAAFSFDSFLMDGASAANTAWFAADLGIKATLGLLAALAVTWLARRSSAALRHRVWFLTYCGLLLLPVLPLVLPKWQIPLPSAFARTRPEVSQTLPAVPHESRPAEAPHQNHPESQPERDPVVSSPQDDFSWSADGGTTRGAEQRRTAETAIEQSPAVTTPTLVAATQPTRSPIQPPGRSVRLYVGALIAVWLTGALVSLFGIVAGRRRGRQLLRLAEPVLDRRWLDPFEQLRENLRVTGRVTLLESSQAAVPMATGILRHAVLLPRETEEWPTALRRYVLIHELAHVKRRDVLQHLISSVATALYWFHPLAWYGMRRMRLEREIACDDCVLMAGEHPCDYAAELVGIARRLHGITTPWAVCMTGGSTLEGRVRSMLDRARSHGPLSAGAARSLLIAALAAIALLAAVEPGASSVRKPEPASSAINKRALETPSQVKAGASLVDIAAANMALAQVNDKQRVVTVSKVPVSKDPTYSFAGTVVDLQGRAVAAAKISLSYFRSQAPAADPTAAVSDAQGRYEFSRKQSDLADLYDERYLPEMRVVAVKGGYGFASVPATACEKTGQLAATIHELKNPWGWPIAEKASNVLTLVPDDLPIRGRLLSVDGRAVAGARITVVGVWADENGGSLDAFEASLKEGPGWKHIAGLFRGYSRAGAMNYQGDKRWYGAAAVLNERRPPVIAPVQSDANGRFTITGLGRERMAEVLITAPGLETTLKFVRTQRGPVLRMGGPHAPISEEIASSECSLVLAPSVPIEGRVLDAKTRQPLAGVRVQPATTVFAHTFTDAQGLYRMEALPLGSNFLEIIPPKGSRYLRGGVIVETTAGSPRAVRDISLAAGIIVHGQALDERTHRPAQGNLQYFVFEPNPLLDKTDSLHFVSGDGVGTDAEGRFEIAALPGAGILGFQGARFKGAPGFPRGVGGDRIQGPLQNVNGGFKRFRTAPSFCDPQDFNLVVPLNPRADDRDVTLDLKLRSGVDVPVRLVASDGQAQSGEFFVLRDGGFWRYVKEDHFMVDGYFPTETLRLEVYDPGRNLVGTAELTGPPPAMLTMTLHPGASIAGRVLDEDGLPVPYAPIGCGRSHQATTDAQGRFEIKGLMPGSKYTATTSLMRREGNRRQREVFDLFTDVTAQSAGETKQLGDLRVKSQEIKTTEKGSGAPKGPKTATSEPSQQAQRDSKHAEPASSNARLRLAGRALKPNGDPAIGATVLFEGFLSPFAGGEGKWALVADFSTDARGAFDRDFDGRWRPGDFASVRLSAIMPGYGRSITVQPWTKDLRSIVLRLADDEPIQARILNLEGRPIAGVRVEAVQVYPSKKEWLDRWLASIPPNAEFSGIGRGMDEKAAQMKGAATSALNFPAASIEMDPLAGLPSAVTDAEGKVELRGLGRDGLVLLKIVGPGIAAAKIYALTRPTKTIEFNRGSQPVRQVLSVYGSQFDYIAGPATVITGIVRDDETKKPIAGAIVASDALDGVRTASGGKLSATTDVEGRYRLDGLSRNRRITVTAMRPNSEYMPTDIEVGQPRVFEPVREDITLERGVWAVGRVFNIKSGQPVAATLFYTPFRSNEFAQEIRRSRQTGFLDYVPAGNSDDQGRFRIPILPGRGVIAVRAFGAYVPGFGASKSKELSNQKTEITTFDTLIPTVFDAVAEVDLKPKAAELRIDVPVDPGQDVIFKFVDRAGHRVSGARVYGMMPRRDGLTKTDTITIPATSPDQTRIMWIDQVTVNSTGHKPGGLCKFVYFKPLPGERERTITLDPPAVLTGRLVSPTGEPLRDVVIGGMYAMDYNFSAQLSETRTDAQGRFRYEIPGGGPFRVGSQSSFGGFLALARDLTVESGEQIDFGELVVSTKGFSGAVTAKSRPKRTPPSAADTKHKEWPSSKKLGS